MMFDNYKEYKNLVDDITNNLNESNNTEGNDFLNNVLPLIEGDDPEYRIYSGKCGDPKLEDRLCNLLHGLLICDDDQSELNQDNVEHGKVGMVGVLGHGGKVANTDSAKIRQIVDPMTSYKKALDDKDENREEEEDKKEKKDNYINNLLNVINQMPDRGHDEELGKSGFVMGDTSPGRSF